MGCMLINRFYLKDHLSFKQIDLEFEKGLVVFTGPSGAGKSVLMGSILSLFGFGESKASLAEVSILDNELEIQEYDIQKDDEIVIKQLGGAKTRYLLNNQTISKKNLKHIGTKLAAYLHHKDTSDFDNNSLLNVLDFLCSTNITNHKQLLGEFYENMQKFKEMQKELDKVLQNEKDIDDLKEFAKFEIEKIKAIDPKIEEYDELKSIKFLML
jgi:DNA repair protein RecN (Recombination protein N)